MKAAQGYTLYKGKWITAEEKAERDAEASASAEQQSWLRRLAILRQALLSGSEAQGPRRRGPGPGDPRGGGRQSDRADIRQRSTIPSLRKLAAQVLAGIPGPEASAALVNRLLAEADDEVRTATHGGTGEVEGDRTSSRG